MNPFLSVLYNFFLGWVINVSGRIGHYLRYSYYKRILQKIGNHVILDQGVIIVSPEKVSVGNNVWIDKNTQILGGESVTIGDHVHIAQNCLIQGVGTVEIGDYVGIGAGCMIFSGTDTIYGQKHISPMLPKKFRNPILKGKVIIKPNAFIGAGCVIHPDVTIGEGAVVGSCSLVTKDVSPWIVVVGCPAKPIKKRIKIEVMS